MIEYQIINSFLNKETFNNYHRFYNLDYVKKHYPVVYKIQQTLRLLWDRVSDEIPEVTLQDVEALFFASYPVLKEAERVEIEKTFREIVTAGCSEMVTSLLEQHRNRAIAAECSIMALDVAEGREDALKLVEMVSTIGVQNTVEEEQHKFITHDLEELKHETMSKPGLRWRLDAMNKMLGSLRKGDFGFLFARPETGKTTFLASEVTYMAEQAQTPVVWFNNEEQGNKVMVRCYQAATGKNLTELYSDIDGNTETFYKKLRGNLKIYDAGTIHRKQVEEVCKMLNPSLIIFDQIDKIKGWKEDRHDLMMKDIYQWARELAKTYGPVIGVCQAGGTGEGKKFLTMDDVDSSKTAKQGEADWILGIGKSHNDGEEFIRYLHLSKNKLSGDEDTIPDLRHGKESVIIRPDVARYGDLQRS